MENDILNFPKQFDFEPVIENVLNFKSAKNLVVAGMGGSHLSAGLFSIHPDSPSIYIHQDYGLPKINHSSLDETLFIASSYSGNTEEVLDFAQKAYDGKLNLAVIASGGQLLSFAKEKDIPYIVLPNTNIQPRMALGFSILALVKLAQKDKIYEELKSLSLKLDPVSTKSQGGEIARLLPGKVPVIYSSHRYFPLAYIWKIKFNENSKVPAFVNSFPELNHNEMSSFDFSKKNQSLSRDFIFIFLKNNDDHLQIKKRMRVCEKLYLDHDLPVLSFEHINEDLFEKIFNTVLMVDWITLELAKYYDVDPLKVPMIEEFKKLIK